MKRKGGKSENPSTEEDEEEGERMRRGKEERKTEGKS